MKLKTAYLYIYDLDMTVPHQDYHFSYIEYIMRKWQAYWDQIDDGIIYGRRNKLKINPMSDPEPMSKEEIESMKPK